MSAVKSDGLFRWMRNTHLVLALAVFFMALIFAVSSVVIIYRPFLPESPPEEQTRTVTVPAAEASTPRALALYLMRTEGLRGELRQITDKGDAFGFTVVAPGFRAEVNYSRASGEARVMERRMAFRETLVQLHTNHGLWHDFMPSNLWALVGLLASIGLILLGASGIYLWFKMYNERKIGWVMMAVGLAWGLGTLILTRMT